MRQRQQFRRHERQLEPAQIEHAGLRHRFLGDARTGNGKPV
jgi:hypothetical protein